MIDDDKPLTPACREHPSEFIMPTQLDPRMYAFDYLVWTSLFPGESPSQVRSHAFLDASPSTEPEDITPECLAETLWLDWFAEGERATFCEMIEDDMDALFPVDDDVIVHSIARTLMWKGGMLRRTA